MIDFLVLSLIGWFWPVMIARLIQPGWGRTTIQWVGGILVVFGLWFAAMMIVDALPGPFNGQAIFRVLMHFAFAFSIGVGCGKWSRHRKAKKAAKLAAAAVAPPVAN